MPPSATSAGGLDRGHRALSQLDGRRITPQTTDDDRHEVQQRFGLDDAWPVVGEPFAQGLLEHAFTAGRPPYEHACVQVVDDAEPHELMKPRLLNVSHRALCYFAYLDGCTRGYMNEQGSPTLSRPDLEGYRATLIERFSNPVVRETVARLCAESSDRIPEVAAAGGAPLERYQSVQPATNAEPVMWPGTESCVEPCKTGINRFNACGARAANRRRSGRVDGSSPTLASCGML